MIPDEAVEAAARALQGEWGDWTRRARIALEAAAPYMLAYAWDEGAEDNADHWAQTANNSNPLGPVDPPSNPYRSLRRERTPFDKEVARVAAELRQELKEARAEALRRK